MMEAMSKRELEYLQRQFDLGATIEFSTRGCAWAKTEKRPSTNNSVTYRVRPNTGKYDPEFHTLEQFDFECAKKGEPVATESGVSISYLTYFEKSELFAGEAEDHGAFMWDKAGISVESWDDLFSVKLRDGAFEDKPWEPEEIEVIYYTFAPNGKLVKVSEKIKNPPRNSESLLNLVSFPLESVVYSNYKRPGLPEQVIESFTRKTNERKKDQ